MSKIHTEIPRVAVIDNGWLYICTWHFLAIARCYVNFGCPGGSAEHHKSVLFAGKLMEKF